MAVKGKKLYDQLFGSNGIAKTSSTSSKVAKQTKTATNLKRRLEAGGVDVDKETDKRNFVEKFLNLPEGQNLISDIFDIINRPQQALFGGWKSAQEGGSFLEGASEGIKGNLETRFKEILHNYGMEDSADKFGIDDVVGFAGDVLLDPVDLAFIPVTGGTSLALNAVDTTGDIAKGAKAVANVADTANDTIKFKSLSDLAFEGLQKGAKAGLKGADNLVGKGLRALDATKGVEIGDTGKFAKLEYLNDAATDAGNLLKKVTNADEIGKAGANVTGRYESYRKLKDEIRDAFVLKKPSKKALEAVRETGADSDKYLIETAALRDTQQNIINKYAKENKLDATQVSKDLADFKEYKFLDRSMEGNKLLKSARNGNLSATDNAVSYLTKLKDDFNASVGEDVLDFTITDAGKIKLNDNWKPSYLKSIDKTLDPEALSEMVDLGNTYSKKQLKHFKELEKNQDFQKLYSETDNIFNDANALNDKYFGTNMAERYAENKGYVPHVLKENYLKEGGLPEGIREAVYKGNTGTLKERNIQGSIAEINDYWNKKMRKNYSDLSDSAKKFLDENPDLFENNIMSAFDKKYFEDIPKLAKQDKMINKVLVDETFGNMQEAAKLPKKIKEASSNGDTALVKELTKQYNNALETSNIKMLSSYDNKVPNGFTRLTGDEQSRLVRKLETMSDELGSSNLKDLTKFVKKSGDKVAINTDVLRLLEVQSPKDVKQISRYSDKLLNFYKRNKVMSPTFLMNNAVGNSSNLYLGGINLTKQAQLAPQALEVYTKGDNLMKRRLAGEVLSDADNKIADLWEDFRKTGFGAKGDLTALDIQDMPDSIKKYFSGDRSPKTLKEIAIDGIPYLNNKANISMDNINRLMVMIEAQNNPTFLKKLGVDNASDAIRKIMFDPSELTEFEKKYMKKIAPFYTFAKNNLAFQLDNMGKQGNRYYKMNKTIEELQRQATNGNEEDLADYIKNSMYIPLPGLGEDGSYKILRAQLPFGQLTDLASDPLQSLVSYANPLMKLPIELATNTNSFTGNELESYSGEKADGLLGALGISKKGEHVLGGLTGLDVPAKQVSRAVDGFTGTEGNVLEKIGGSLGNLTTMGGNTNTDKLYKLYDEIEQLQDTMSKYKDAGYEFSTINELNKANTNSKLKQIMATLRQYQ